MIVKVLKIEEDLDYGCEERREGEPVLAVLTVEDAKGNRELMRYPDRELYRLQINEGDMIRWDPQNGEIQKWEE